MKVKAEQLKILQDFLVRTQNEVYSAELSYKLYELRKVVNDLIDGYNHVLNKAIDECLIKEDNGNIKMSPEGRIEIQSGKEEKWKTFTKELDEMEFEIIKPLFSQDSIKELKVSPLEIELLQNLIVK